jgi:GNAT superfamily N-acetyltransferase
MGPTDGHPLAVMLAQAAAGRFPPPDGVVDVVPSPPGRSDAVVAFTAHSVVAAPVPEGDVRAQLDPDDLGAATDARFLAWLAGRLATAPGMLDLVLVAPARPAAEPLVERADLADHPRLERARLYRDDVTAFEDAEGRGLIVLGHGLAGRLEVAIEVEPEQRGRGLGRRLAAAALGLPAPGELVYAQVTPGNTASLRAFLAAGYRPIGSEVLFLRK